MMTEKIIEMLFNNNEIPNMKYMLQKPLGSRGLADQVSSPSFVANVLEVFQQQSRHAPCKMWGLFKEI